MLKSKVSFKLQQINSLFPNRVVLYVLPFIFAWEIILVGKRNFEIDKYEIYKLISNEKIIKIKNKTKINYNLNSLANENTLKGLFAQEMLKKLNDENISIEQKEIIENAIEIGFEALD